MWKMPHEPPSKEKCDRIYWPRMRHCRISVIFGGRHLHVLAFSPPSRHSSAIAISSDNSSRIFVVAQKAVSFEHASDPVSDRFGREEDFLEMKRTLSSAFEWESSVSHELVLVWVTLEFNSFELFSDFLEVFPGNLAQIWYHNKYKDRRNLDNSFRTRIKSLSRTSPQIALPLSTAECRCSREQNFSSFAYSKLFTWRTQE